MDDEFKKRIIANQKLAFQKKANNCMTHVSISATTGNVTEEI